MDNKKIIEIIKKETKCLEVLYICQPFLRSGIYTLRAYVRVIGTDCVMYLKLHISEDDESVIYKDIFDLELVNVEERYKYLYLI